MNKVRVSDKIPSIEQPSANTSHYLRFRVGDQWYGINVHDLVEVLPIMYISPLPTEGPDVLGLIKLRDVVIPILDLRVRFGNLTPEYRIDTPILTIQTPQGVVGIMVDDADNVETISEQEIVKYEAGQFPYVSGVIQSNKGMLLILDKNAISINNLQSINSPTSGELHKV